MFNATPTSPRVSQALSLPVGTGGLNDLDPLSAMNPEFLIDCINFFADTGLLTIRPGYQEWAINLTASGASDVSSIMYFNAMDGSFQRFASTSNQVYNITNPTNAPAQVHLCTNGYWQFCNFATSGGQYMVACNGHDPAFIYNGTTFTDFTEVTTPAGPGEISGVDPSLFDNVIAHKGRLWFIERDSMTAWYLDIDAVGGTAHPFYLSGIFRRGGKLTCIARWSSDTGEGLDDRLIFVSSSGEIASYAGTDPSSADTWSLDSIFFVAPPLGKRAITEYGGDLLMLCRRGLIPLSSLISGKANEILFSDALTRRISRSLIQLTSMENPPFPAEVNLYNDSAWTIINIYDGSNAVASPYNRTITSPGGGNPIQLVQNFLTGAWGKFDYPVRTVQPIDRLLFMGTDDGRVVVVTPNSFIDNIPFGGTGGDPIEGYAMGAYSYFNDPTTNKHAKLMRPVFHTEVKPSFTMRALPDFRLDRFTQIPAPNFATGNAKWDISKWDQSNWAGLENVYRPWVSANVLGFAFAWQLRVSTSSPLGVAAIEWVWESGGFV